MHPAYSVIFFTTASGAGYGLLVWLAALGLAGVVAPASTLGLVGFGLAFALVGGGLLSSTAHLGRPERAWRAFSQWQSSWLSREGVLAVLSFAPAGLLAILWVFTETFNAPFALATIALSLATVYSTGMIYQSLPTIKAWHHPLTAPNYVVLGLATGGVLAMLLLSLFSIPLRPAIFAAIGLLLLATLLKWLYWNGVDALPRPLDTGRATGLGHMGKVKMLIQPHSMENFVMREMGYAIARKHAEKLRAMSLLFALVVPAILLLLSLFVLPDLAIGLALLAVISAAMGIVTERWLFFAEAEHVVNLYYGAERR